MTIRHSDDRGVSVIVGTLLMILITVTAAGALAVMISEFQKEDMERQTHLSAVENEKIEISGISPELNNTFWNEYYNTTDIQYNNWSAICFDLINMDVNDARINSVQVNGRYADNFTAEEKTYSLKRYLFIPATKKQTVRVDLVGNYTVDNPLIVGDDDAVTIRVMTSLYNTFEATFKPPTPVVQAEVVTEDLEIAKRSVLVLDGTDSTDDDGSVMRWDWRIEDASATYPSGNWTDSANLTIINPSSGPIVRYEPQSDGPFRVFLNVTDNTGMVGRSGYYTIEENQMFNPPVRLSAEYNPVTYTLVLAVNSTIDEPCIGAPITIAKISDYYGNLTLSGWNGVTGTDGTLTVTHIKGEGLVKITSEDLAPAYISLPMRDG